MEGYYWDENTGMVRTTETGQEEYDWAFDDDSLSDNPDMIGYENDVLIEDFHVLMTVDVPTAQQYSGGRSIGTFRSSCNKDETSIANTSITLGSTDTSNPISSLTDPDATNTTEVTDAVALEQIYERNPQLLERLLDSYKSPHKGLPQNPAPLL